MSFTQQVAAVVIAKKGKGVRLPLVCACEHFGSSAEYFMQIGFAALEVLCSV
jgi:hypothetical protein